MQRGRSLVCSREREEANMAEVEVGREKMVGEEFKGVI